MKKVFTSPIKASDGSLTLVGFFWLMAAIMTGFFTPLILFSL
tara:strand:- start:855 stop:980 length:126 start_codon:yes stop_codon:yes gene_type:complete